MVDDGFYKVPKAMLFQWYSTVQGITLFPGMESKIGKQQFQELMFTDKSMEKVIGVIVGDQGFNGG